MKMLLATGITILFFAYASCQRQEGNTVTFKWQRNINPDAKPFYVEEHASVLRPGVILMSSESPALHEKQYHRSQSLHDFTKGILAIKHLDTRGGRGICFLTHPAKTFDETVKDLQTRAGMGEVVLEEPEHFYKVPSKESVPRTDSISVNNFCRGAPMYQVEEFYRPFPRDYPWIIRTLCIYWPLRFWWPIDFPVDFVPTFYV
ncbi:uncharacterized protein LOC124256636 [Haliotis rubra]|uniref:uncharacterized protein LOC124256636 n=1 Tax=Haliotis rubra TaxID=36100 RepID=UPI001EE546F8|nr:uncharacterized protein LOC124256636 [Haliotis rubra]